MNVAREIRIEIPFLYYGSYVMSFPWSFRFPFSPPHSVLVHIHTAVGSTPSELRPREAWWHWI